jgi:hypothetical protein
MQPGQILVLVVLLFALVLGWSVSHGHSAGIPLYVLALVIPVALLAGAAAQLLNADAAVEAFNVIAIAFALAVLPSHPSLWQEQMQADLRRMRLVQPLDGRDLLSWRGWLKLVDRAGARRAALAYFAIYVVAIAAALGSTFVGPTSDRTIYTTLAVLAPALFAVLSTIWIYQGARRLVPGA